MPSGGDINVSTVSGQDYFGYTPFTQNNTTGEITFVQIYINTGTYNYGGEIHTLEWTDGNENVGGVGTWYADLKNCVTHEI